MPFLPTEDYTGEAQWYESLTMSQGGSMRNFTDVMGPFFKKLRNSDLYLLQSVQSIIAAVELIQAAIMPTSRWLVIPGTAFQLLPTQTESDASQVQTAGTATAGTDHVSLVNKQRTATPYRYYHCVLALPWRTVRIIGAEVTSSRDTNDASIYFSLRKLNRVGTGHAHLDPVYPDFNPDSPPYGAGIDGFVECAGVAGGESTVEVLDGSTEYSVDLTSASLQLCIALQSAPTPAEWDVFLSKVALNIVPEAF